MSNFFAYITAAKQPRKVSIGSLAIRRLPMTSLSIVSLSVLSLWIAGCASQLPAKTVHIETAPPPIVEPVEPFSTETLYSLMVAELAGSRDRLDIMLSNYIKQAIDTQDVGVTERAAHLANFVRDSEATLQMANQWAALAPHNTQARYMAMAALSDAGRYFEAFEHGRYLLNHSAQAIQAPKKAHDTQTESAHSSPSVTEPTPQYSAHGLDALAVKATNSDASQETLEALLKLYTPLREQYPQEAELALAVSFLEYPLDRLPQALANAKSAQKLRADYQQAYIQELRVLGAQNPEIAQKRLGEIVQRFPNNQRLRLQYARNLTQNDLSGATVQFEELLKQAPGDGNIQLALALTYYQLDNLDAAKMHFTPLTSLTSARPQAHADTEPDMVSLIAATPAQTATAYYYLGKIAQQQDAPLEAIEYYVRVLPSKEFFPALAQAVSLMHQHQQQQAALQLLLGHQLTADEGYQEGIHLLLADHYRSQGLLDQAKQTLSDAIQQFPRSQHLLFNRAMIFVTLNNMVLAENDLQTILAINPDNTDALNTLGYILVDANTRLEEGKSYIERSLNLAPNNPATIDSLGWAYYRLGQYAKATALLKQALKLMPSDEIAAHLGEVLWVSGQKDSALAVWKQGLALNPRSAHIHQRLKEFNLLSES
ncbi:tetratricopeptide repeat protein [Marinagarivorans algicola]|uniref:tetratricopeptide repeat protein n=1 Tax=Marinagarivorans algicola TaxID=1513270 RepID=UPI0009EB31C9|nr:tetratricopeptide repeat protein [Marinagarivorans algicola]